MKYSFNKELLNLQNPQSTYTLFVGGILAMAIAIPTTFSYLETKVGIKRHGSVACAESAKGLNEVFDYAVLNDNQLLLAGVLDEALDYQEGRGDNALGHECKLPELSEKIENLPSLKKQILYFT